MLAAPALLGRGADLKSNGTRAAGSGPGWTWARAALISGGLLAAVGAGGCQDPLFTPDEARSQYDRFDAVRDRRAPTYVYDEFGARRPNLRGRLLTSE